MMRSHPDADDTVRIVPRTPPPPPTRGPLLWVAVGAVAAALAMGIGGWLVWPRQAVPPLPVASSGPARAPQVTAAPAPEPPAPPAPLALAQQPASGLQPTQGQQAASEPREPPAPQQSAGQSAVAGQKQPAQFAGAERPALRPPPTQQQGFAQPAPFQLSPAEPSPTQPYPAPPDAALPPVSLASIRTADEAEIRAHAPTGVSIFRFAANPSIIVLDFASLREQGLMLNRVAALIEKSQMPRNRVLNDLELGAAISASGDTVETFYYGHDYSAAAIAWFFTLAAQERVVLDPQEEWLQRLLNLLGWFGADARGGLISVPAVGANAEVTVAARNAILRHELSHGEYFTNAAYAAYVHRFWSHVLTPAEQGGVRNFLASDEYDPKVEDLVENEMQAYLMFTRDPLFFAPAKVGVTPERLAELQIEFHRGMPHGWLRDLLGQTLPLAAPPY